jgi:hypothetical protein
VINTEQIERAAHVMRSAAEGMKNAMLSLDYALQQNQRFLDDWLNRLEAVVKELKLSEDVDTMAHPRGGYSKERPTL